MAKVSVSKLYDCRIHELDGKLYLKRVYGYRPNKKTKDNPKGEGGEWFEHKNARLAKKLGIEVL